MKMLTALKLFSFNLEIWFGHKIYYLQKISYQHMLTWLKFCEWHFSMDNMRTRHVIALDRCCLCKRSGETIYHIIFHCDVARELWALIFHLFGLEWVMPQSLVELLASEQAMAK
jgi:hypothetical protein